MMAIVEGVKGWNLLIENVFCLISRVESKDLKS